MCEQAWGPFVGTVYRGIRHAFPQLDQHAPEEYFVVGGQHYWYDFKVPQCVHDLYMCSSCPLACEASSKSCAKAMEARYLKEQLEGLLGGAEIFLDRFRLVRSSSSFLLSGAPYAFFLVCTPKMRAPPRRQAF